MLSYRAVGLGFGMFSGLDFRVQDLMLRLGHFEKNMTPFCVPELGCDCIYGRMADPCFQEYPSPMIVDDIS